MTELVKVKRGTGKSITKNVLLTYDTFASHSTMDASLVAELGLPVESVGDMSVQTHFVTKRMEGKLTSASINGVRLQFLVSSQPQTVPQYTYSVPAQWRRFGLTHNHLRVSIRLLLD